MQVIVWTQPSGMIAVCTPVDQAKITDEQARVVAPGVTSYIVDVDTLPLHPEDNYFDALRMDDKGTISVNLAAAQTLATNSINAQAGVEYDSRSKNTALGLPNTPDDAAWLAAVVARRAAVAAATTLDAVKAA